MSQLATRVIWFGSIAMIAIVGLFAQLDRQSRYSPELSAAVPEAMRSFSQYHYAAAATTAATDPDIALIEARRLLERRPMPAEHLSLLASAQGAAGRQVYGLQTIQSAARRGWRDTAAQSAMLRLAIVSDDGIEAARRLAAIWALAPSDDVLSNVAPQVLARPDAMAEFARLLASSPRWESAVRQRGPRVLPEDQMSELLLRADAAREAL